MSEALEIGKKLVALCREHKEMEAMETLYSPAIISVEAGTGSPTMPRVMEGIEAVKGKGQWWVANHEIHEAKVDGPWPNDDKFIVRFTYVITPKMGPMMGKRITMDEAALYTVSGGKIVREEFFYSMG